MYVTQENEGILNGIDYIQSQLKKMYEQEQEYFKKIFEAVKPKLDEKITNDSIFMQDIFNFIYACSDDELYNTFNKIVEEINRRKDFKNNTQKEAL